jgi:hypothetical protein
MKNQKQSATRKKINEFYEHQEYLSIQQNPNRARSVTIGTAFGGVVELIMRSDAATIWAQMQPVEAIELMEQIAAGCGVEIAMRPKQNFASWRGWEEILDRSITGNNLPWKGSAPYQLRQDEEELKLLEEKPKSKRKRTRKKVEEVNVVINEEVNEE